MSALVLDAGAFICVERGSEEVTRKLAAARLNGIILRTSAIILGQVWRDGRGRQAMIARLLSGMDVLPVDLSVGLAAGTLIGKAGTRDPIDAAVVLAAQPGDTILPGDIEHLSGLARSGIAVVAC